MFSSRREDCVVPGIGTICRLASGQEATQARFERVLSPLSLADRSKQINQSLIRFSSLRCKPRNNVAKIGTIERRIFVNPAREKALTQRAERDESDAELLETGDLLIRVVSTTVSIRSELPSPAELRARDGWFGHRLRKAQSA